MMSSRPDAARPLKSPKKSSPQKLPVKITNLGRNNVIWLLKR
jgi:hypothetical protein